ncbi:primosomal replication protein N [Burkholderiaceae bacterium DAT-1]|nr:primosomal replication protein N [Burkholderiaceae bacterium DAT-1]
MSARNTVVASGKAGEFSDLRYTPAGIPVYEFRLFHESEQTESGFKRQVQCEFICQAIGEHAVALTKVSEGTTLIVKGFMAARSRRHPASLVLHVTDWKIDPELAHHEF